LCLCGKNTLDKIIKTPYHNYENIEITLIYIVVNRKKLMGVL